jgi:hypothetical protein
MRVLITAHTPSHRCDDLLWREAMANLDSEWRWREAAALLRAKRDELQARESIAALGDGS